MLSLDFISDNPFRILGVYANSSLKEIVANRSKMNVFLKVGRHVSFPLDLDNYLGPVDRTTTSVEAADSRLTIESDRLRAAQFWFFTENTQFDVIAGNHLSCGDLDGAISVWQKKESFSSLQNVAIASLLLGRYDQVAYCLSRLYARYRSEFLAALDIKTEVREEDLVETALSTIFEANPDINADAILQSDGSQVWDKVAAHHVIMPICRKIDAAVNDCRQSRHAAKEVRLAAGQKLNTAGKALLAELGRFLPPDNQDYCMMSDEVANQVMQAGIDYYNAANDPQAAAQTRQLLDAADALAMGTVVRQRINENRDIIAAIMDSLPPAQVRQEADEINRSLDRFSKLPKVMSQVESLLEEVEPRLNRIRSKVGAASPYYLSISSVIVMNALNSLIADVNDKQRAFSADTSDSRKLKAYRLALNIATSLSERLSRLGMDAETRQRFDSNRQILTGLVNQLPKEPYKVPLVWQIVFYAIMALLIYTCNSE